MKNVTRSILAIMLAVVITASIAASGINEALDLTVENDSEIVLRIDEEKEPDCSPNYDESWFDTDWNEY